MKIQFYDVAEFVAELNECARQIVPKVVRLTVGYRHQPPMVAVSVRAGFFAGAVPVVLTYQVGECFAGQLPTELEQKIEAARKAIEDAAAAHGLAVRAGSIED